MVVVVGVVKVGVDIDPRIKQEIETGSVEA